MTTGPTNTTTAPLTPADHGEAVNGLTKAIELADTAAEQYEQNAEGSSHGMAAAAWRTMAKDARDLRARLTLALSVVKASPPAEPNIRAEAHPWASRMELAKWIIHVERTLGIKCISTKPAGCTNNEARFLLTFDSHKTVNWSAFATENICVALTTRGSTLRNGRLVEEMGMQVVMTRQPSNITPFPVPGPKDEKPVTERFDTAFGGSPPVPEALAASGSMTAHLIWAAERMEDEAAHLDRLATAAVDCGARADMIHAKISAIRATAAQIRRAAGVIEAVDHPATALPNCRAMAIAQVLRWIWVPSSGYQLEGCEWLTDYRVEGTELKKIDVVTNP